MDVIEKFGNRVSSQALKDPEKARRLLLAGYRLQEKKLQFLPDRGLPSSGQYVARVVMKNIIQSLSEPENAAMVSIFVPGELVMAAGLDGIEKGMALCAPDRPTGISLPDAMAWEPALEQLLVYFLYRQMPLALDDGEYEGRAAFAVLSFAIIRRLLLVHFALHGSVVLADLIEIARQYSAEIEYSDENVEILLYRIQEVL